MANYTMTVYELIQNNFDFGLNDYPIFNEEYRVILNNAILEYYKWYEIGFQNPYLWRDRLRQRMDLIMRNKFNALYEIKQTEFNPLYNIEMTETFTHQVDNTTNSNSNEDINSLTKTSSSGTMLENITENIDSNENINNTNENSVVNNTLALTSQFPSEEMTENDLTDNIYVDNANKGKSENKTLESGNTSTITSNSKESNSNNSVSNDLTNNVENSTTSNSVTNGTVMETYTRHQEGSSAGLPFSKAMLQFKEYLDNFQLDLQVILELKDLFMLVW